MHIGSTTSAPHVYGPRVPQRIHGIAPVTGVNTAFPDQDPLDHLTGSDRALLAHLQAGVIDVDRMSGTAVAALAREIAHLRATGIVPEGRPLTSDEISLLVTIAMSAAVRPMPAEVHARVVSHLPRSGATSRVDILL